MTDNRITELLPCPFCGGEAECHKWWSATISGDYATFCAECGCGTDYFKTEAEAIAAWNARADYHGYEQAAIEAWENIKAWNTRATHGTLTAEQVSKATYAHSIHADCADADWQAIADELNAELGSRTCEIECFDDGVDEMDGEWFSYAPPTWYLSCGHTAQGTEKPNFCPNCGARIRKAVER